MKNKDNVNRAIKTLLINKYKGALESYISTWFDSTVEKESERAKKKIDQVYVDAKRKICLAMQNISQHLGDLITAHQRDGQVIIEIKFGEICDILDKISNEKQGEK